MEAPLRVRASAGAGPAAAATGRGSAKKRRQDNSESVAGSPAPAPNSPAPPASPAASAYVEPVYTPAPPTYRADVYKGLRADEMELLANFARSLVRTSLLLPRQAEWETQIQGHFDRNPTRLALRPEAKKKIANEIYNTNHKAAERSRTAFFTVAWAARLDEVSFTDAALEVLASRAFLHDSEFGLTNAERDRANGYRALWLRDKEARRTIIANLVAHINKQRSEAAARKNQRKAKAAAGASEAGE